jgi:DNA polymerase-3 subunit beta
MTKLKISHKEISIAIKAVTPSKKTKNPTEIDLQVLIRALGTKMKLTYRTEDAEVTKVIDMADSVPEKVAFTLPLKKLADLVSGMPSDSTVTITKGDEKHSLSCSENRSRYTMVGHNPSDFPLIGNDVSKKQSEIKIKSEDLIRAIKSVKYAAAHQDVRYYLNGVSFKVSSDFLQLTSTDGHRLADCKISIDNIDNFNANVILATPTINDIQTIMEDNPGEVTLSFSSNHLIVNVEETTVIAKLIDGKFPDCERVIPSDSEIRVVVDKSKLKSSLKQAKVLSNEKFNGAKFIFGPEILQIIANNPTQEEASEEFEVLSSDLIHKITLGMNITYLAQAINSIPDDHIVMTLRDETTSVLITSPNCEGLRAVVMPMKL